MSHTRIQLTLILALSAICVTGCLGGTYQGYANFRNANRQSLMRVEVGMTKQRVLEIFGNDSYYAFTNPYKSEVFPTKDGVVEIIYYYTDYNDYGSGKSLET